MSTNKQFTLRNNDGEYTITVAPCQKVFEIQRVLPTSIHFTSVEKANDTLSRYAFGIYMYMLCKDNRRLWALSSKDVCKRHNISINTYNKAIHELIEKGYLVETDIVIQGEAIKNAYTFRENNE